MAFYRVCPFCGACLDPGEICECKKEAASDDANIRSGRAEQKSNQLNYSNPHCTECMGGVSR